MIYFAKTLSFHNQLKTVLYSLLSKSISEKENYRIGNDKNCQSSESCRKYIRPSHSIPIYAHLFPSIKDFSFTTRGSFP